MIALNVKKHVLNVPNVEKIGVYAIHNKKTNKFYVGSSINIKSRMRSHRSNIEKLQGSNLKMDEDLKTLDDVKNFEFLVIETFEDYKITEMQLRQKESDYIDYYDANNGYNNPNRTPFVNGYFEKNELLVCKKATANKKRLTHKDVRKMSNFELLHRYAEFYNNKTDCCTSVKIAEREILKRMDKEKAVCKEETNYNTPRGRKENKMKDMGMTDKQFNGFIRFLIDGLEEVKEESDAEKKDERLQKILDNLQSTLED